VVTPTRQNWNLVSCDVTTDQYTVAYKLHIAAVFTFNGE